MLGWHLTVASQGRQALFTGEESVRRAAVRVIARIAGSEIVVFGLADDHLHLVLQATRKRAGRIAQALNRALTAVVPGSLQSAHLAPVERRAHAESLVTYVLGQLEHHGLPGHPALWSGSCFPDLVGARAVAGLHLRVRELLPRFALRTAYRAVGLKSARPIQPASDAEVRAVGVGRLIQAAGATLAVGPGLAGCSAESVAARRVAAQLARRVRLSTADVAWGLGLSCRSVQRYARSHADERAIRALRMRLSLEEICFSSHTPQGLVRPDKRPA